MTQSKSTKRALLTSVLAMLVCVAMLIGSTFAWFTDSVTSGNNKIVAGNLDVELEYWDGTDWQTVTEDTNLFKPTEGEDATLWEPGHTEYVQLRIRNVGTLALTYDFSVSVYGDENGGEEKEYTNMDGGKFKLSDYLVFSKTDGVNPTGTMERENLWLDSAAEAAAMGNLSGLAMNGELLEAEESKEFTLAVYMPTSVGNAANQSTAARETEGAPTIYLGLTLLATQTPYEEDSFGNDYDKAAAVRTEADLLSAVKNGGTVVLFDDVELKDNRLVVESETVLDLNGKTITFGGNYVTAGANNDVTPIRVNAGGTLTITGNGTIDATDASDYVVPVSVMAAGGSVVIENGTIIVDTPRESCVFAMGGSVTIKGGTFINNSTDDYTYGNGAPLTLNLSNGTPGTISVYGGTFVGRDPAEGDDNLGGTFIASGYQSTEVSTGTYIVTEAGTTPVVSSSGLRRAVSNAEPGSTIMLKDDIVLTDNGGFLGVPAGITLDLQENTLELSSLSISQEGETVIQNGTISGEGLEGDFYGLINVYGNTADRSAVKVTLQNVVVDVTGTYEDLYYYPLNFQYCTPVLNNVTVNGRINFGDSFGVINGGNYTVGAGYNMIINSNFGAEINGGTFTVTGEDQVIFNVSQPSADTSFTINNGTFAYHAAFAPIGYKNLSYPKEYIKINDGTFNGTAYQAEMYDSLLKKLS